MGLLEELKAVGRAMATTALKEMEARVTQWRESTLRPAHRKCTLLRERLLYSPGPERAREAPFLCVRCQKKIATDQEVWIVEK